MAEICDIFFESANQCSMYSVCTYSVYCCIFKGDGFHILGVYSLSDVQKMFQSIFNSYIHECVTKLTSGFWLLVIQGDIFITLCQNVKKKN